MSRLFRPLRSRWVNLDPWGRLAVILWLVIVTATCVRAGFCHLPRHRGVFPVYAEAGQHWRDHADLYAATDGWDRYIYSPLVAVFLVPFGSLPEALGSGAFRLAIAGAYLTALAGWGRTLPATLSRTQFALLFLLVIPLSADTVLSAQAGGFVAALLLLTLAAAAGERWTAAAVCAALATMLKVYPAAVGLLLAVAYPRRFAGRFALALAACLALPFLVAPPEYVARQYAGWVRILSTSDRHHWDLAIANRDVELLFRVWLAPLPVRLYQCIQLLTAAAVAGTCVALRRAGWPLRRLLFALGGLAACWITLFGPVVETFTYILVTPTLAALLVTAWQERRSWAYRSLLLASWGVFTVSMMAVWFSGAIRLHSKGTHPVAGLLLLAALLVELRHWRIGRATVTSDADDSTLLKAA
jgi:hypothetical protein